eukprot:g13880.t1
MSLPEARREYASAKVVALSSQLQELSVARFEVDALPEQREVYVKRGNLLYLTPRPEAKVSLAAQEKEVGEKLAKMQTIAAAQPAAS